MWRANGTESLSVTVRGGIDRLQDEDGDAAERNLESKHEDERDGFSQPKLSAEAEKGKTTLSGQIHSTQMLPRKYNESALPK